MKITTKAVTAIFERYYDTGVTTYSETAKCQECGMEFNPKAIPRFCPECRRIITGTIKGKDTFKAIYTGQNRREGV